MTWAKVRLGASAGGLRRAGAQVSARPGGSIASAIARRDDQTRRRRAPARPARLQRGRHDLGDRAARTAGPGTRLSLNQMEQS